MPCCFNRRFRAETRRSASFIAASYQITLPEASKPATPHVSVHWLMPTVEHVRQFLSNGRDKRMNRLTRHAPTALLLLAAIAMAIHGPIFQPEGYHAFADNRALLGL